TRRAHALQARDHAAVLAVVLEIHAQDSLTRVLDHLEVADVALTQEGFRDLHLEARRGHFHLAVLGPARVAHTGEEIGDGIGQRHLSSPITSWLSRRPGSGPTGRAPGSRSGRSRNDGGTRARVRSGGTGCSRGP